MVNPKRELSFVKCFLSDGKNYKWEVRLGSGQDEESVLKNANDGVKTFEWTVVEDHYAPNQPGEYKDVGVVGERCPDMSLFGEMLDCTSQSYNHPFAQMFIFFWPGQLELQRKKMNEFIRYKHNPEQKELKKNTVKEFSANEWWHGIGIFLYGGVVGGGTERIFPRSPKMKQKLPLVHKRTPIDIMSRTRFEDFKRFLPETFVGDDPTDPWNRLLGLLNGFNENRSKYAASSFRKVLDESMSFFQPRSTPTGGLPNFSFIKRKPRPYGIEYKF